jgi:hypothetical protein
MVKYSVTLHGAPTHNPEAVNLISFTMDAQDPLELIARLHREYVNVSLLKFQPIVTVKK